MERIQLSDLTVFVEVAKLGGFRAAARQLNVGPGTVSEAIQRFEDRLGVRLFDRTTRRITLTRAGNELFKRTLPAMGEIEDAIRELNDKKDAVSGMLRLNAPRVCGSLFLNDLISAYAQKFPQVKVELSYDDQKIDLVSSGLDAVIRYQALVEQDTHVVPIGPSTKMLLVASPDYVKRHGLPKTPAKLIEHEVISYAIAGDAHLAPWSFTRKDGDYIVKPNPRLVVNDMNALIQFALSGLGLTYLFQSEVKQHIESGELVSVLEKDTASLSRHTINYLSKRNMPARLRAFIDLAKSREMAND